MKARLLLPLLSSAALLTGCASASYSPGAQTFGEYRDLHGAMARADDLSWADASDVKVFTGSVPDGITLSSNGQVTADPARYEVLGEVSASPNGGALSRFGAWFYPYPEDESWRKGLCYWQVPLTWITLGFYAWIAPWQYPCRVVDGNSASAIEDRRHRVIATMQKATKALGGNLLLVTGYGGTVTVGATSGVVLGEAELTHGQGIAIRVK